MPVVPVKYWIYSHEWRHPILGRDVVWCMMMRVYVHSHTYTHTHTHTHTNTHTLSHKHTHSHTHSSIVFTDQEDDGANACWSPQLGSPIKVCRRMFFKRMFSKKILWFTSIIEKQKSFLISKINISNNYKMSQVEK